MTSEIDLLTKMKEEFLAERARQEIQVEVWAKKLSKVDKEILKEVPLPEAISLRKLIPELYEEEPDCTIYEEQFRHANDLFMMVNKIADHYNEEAKKCLSEYKEMSLKG